MCRNNLTEYVQDLYTVHDKISWRQVKDLNKWIDHVYGLEDLILL